MYIILSLALIPDSVSPVSNLSNFYSDLLLLLVLIGMCNESRPTSAI